MIDHTVALVVFLLILSICDGRTVGSAAHPGRTDSFELSVIHMNDFHARFEEVSPTAGTCHPEEKDKCIGGLARVVTATKRLMNERPNAIFLNAGDHYQGTLWYNVHRWNVTALFMNMLPHDAMTIGNHEFDNGIDGIVPFLKNVKAPVVVTNIDASAEPKFQGTTRNSTVIIRDGRKIGVIGVILSTTNEIANTEKLKFIDEVEAVNLEAEKLKRNEDVDIVVVLSHCGLDLDRIIAAECPTVDLIVGGHSHSFLYSGSPPFIDIAEDVYPVVVKQALTDRTVLIVQAASYTKYLGNLTVWFDEKGEIIDWEGNPIFLGQGIEQELLKSACIDPQILEALKPWKIAVDAIGKKKIGKTKVILKNDCRLSECNLANFITDAMIDSWMNKTENKSHWTYASIAVINAGGLRTTIGNHVNDPITYSDLISAMPFENTWDIIELQGRDIIKTLEVSVASPRPGLNATGNSFLHWSGLRATFNMEKPTNHRLVDAEIRCHECQLPRYEKIVPDRWYRIVAVSFLVHGGDGHNILANNHRNHRVGSLETDYLVDYIGRMAPIIHGKEHRVIFQ